MNIKNIIKIFIERNSVLYNKKKSYDNCKKDTIYFVFIISYK